MQRRPRDPCLLGGLCLKAVGGGGGGLTISQRSEGIWPPNVLGYFTYPLGSLSSINTDGEESVVEQVAFPGGLLAIVVPPGSKE